MSIKNLFEYCAVKEVKMLRSYLELVYEMEQKVALIRLQRPLLAEPNPCMT